MECDDLAALIEKRRETAPPAPPRYTSWAPARRHGPEALRAIMDRVLASIEAIPKPDPAKIERQRLAHEAAKRRTRWSEFARRIGAAYADCRLSNFVVKSDVQRQAIAAVDRYRQDLATQLAVGHGLLVYGPSGTGKDHLLVGLAHAAIVEYGLCVTWINGVDFFRQIRVGMGDDEAAVINALVWPQVLYFSDPVPPIGELTPFQSAALFAVIDGRCRAGKATWISLNVQDSVEAARRLGASIADRLRDRTTSIRCDWESHRAEGRA